MTTADERTLRRTRGNDISFIFQEPMTSLNPLHTIEKQLGESLALHQGLTGAKARARILELLTQVGIRDPEERLAAYPHQLSGGQRQRVMIAMALANGPDILDRRRADHRPRRHRPGPHPRPPRRGAEGRRAWRCSSSPTTSASSAASPTASR